MMYCEKCKRESDSVCITIGDVTAIKIIERDENGVSKTKEVETSIRGYACLGCDSVTDLKINLRKNAFEDKKES